MNSVQLQPGDHVGPYRIERKLGSGGMADVYYAVHEGLERPAAIKVLRASLATDEVHLQRFMQEARAAASLVHPNIVQVYDVGLDGEHRYIAQEYIAGSNLRQYIAAGERDAEEQVVGPDTVDHQLGLQETLSILLQILAALNKSANSGIVHRDIKPENIMLTKDGESKVADFGLARIVLGDDPQLTRAGTTLGTPMYMSPEQIQEGKVDIRSDLYSLGVTVFHMLTGRPPFTGETPLALAMKHVQADVPDIRESRTDLPSSIVELVAKLLKKDPADRFASPSEVLEFLKQHRSGDLSQIWPEQLVPLPDAGIAGGSGPLQATMALQLMLRKKRLSFRNELLTWGGIAALLFLSFSIGAVMAYSPPSLIPEDPPRIYNDIPKQAKVQEQYRLALLGNEMNRADKWAAVEYYYPKDEEKINRNYAGLASLQLARSFQNLRDYDKAKNVLKKTIDDKQMARVYQALAHLQQASIAEEERNPEEMENAVSIALDIADKDGFSTKDREQLNEVVKSLSWEISSRWFGTRTN